MALSLNKLRLVAVGGGTGLATLLRGIRGYVRRHDDDEEAPLDLSSLTAIVTVSDDAILAAIFRLARTSGVFAEPAGAAALAGLDVALDEGLVGRDERVVLMITGSGLKDVASAAKGLPTPAPVEASLEAVERAVSQWNR